MGPGGGGGGINIFNKSGARAKKEDSDDVRGRMALNNGYDAPPSAISSSPALAHSNGADQHGSSLTVWTPVASGEDVDYRNWKLHFEPDVVSYVSEDTRLSTLQKKLVREPNATTSLAIAFQISDAIMQHENKHYVRRLTDVISDAIVEIFYSKHAEAVKEESARALGKVGFVIAEFSVEFEKFYGWLWKGFDDAKKESVQNLYLKGLASMLELEPRFGGGDQVLHMVMKDLQELLERTNQSGFLITLVDALGTISNWKPKLFEPIFQDVVDILVGWHIDSTQLPAVRTHMSQVLLSWNSYWIIDMEFSSSLLRQFMEDLEAFDEDVAKSDDPDNLKDISERMLSLMQVFNTVLSCLKTRQQNAITFLPPESSVWCENILDSFAKVLDKRHDEDILVVGQHSMILLMERIETLFAQKQKKIMSYVKRNIDLFSSLTFSGQVVTLGFLGRMFMLAGPKAKLTIVQKIVGTKSPVLQTSFCSESRIIRAAVDLFKIMLNSKDIHILQVVYRHLTSLLEESLVCLANCPRFLAKNEFSEEQFKREEHQRIFYFVLACISDIALAKGSVLSMWALDPTIFKLLTNNLGVVAVDFASGQPWLHFAILKLLQSHCSSHGQFISSSDVCASLTSNSISASPTAKYFSVILTLLSSLLKIVSSLCPASSELVLSWSKDVLQETLKSRLYIFDKPEFILFVSSLFKAGQMLGTNKEASKAVLQMIDFILKEFSLEGYYSCYDEAHNLTQLHMRSSDEEIRSLSYSILTSLPPLLVDWKSNEQTFDEKFIEMKKSIVHRKEDKRRSIAPQDFRVFVAAVLNMSAENEGGTAAHKKIVDKTNRQLECSVLSGVAKSKRVVEEYLKNVTNFHDLQTLHMCHSLSHYCINNKLKSPLGKAQDTLTTIEKVIRNVTANLLEGKTANIDMPGCRGLLVLFECLEKAMSNAYNGSAVFMPAPTKVVAVFFQANKDTCIGWISRLRMATIQLAFFAGDYAYVVRNAQESLARLAAMAASSGKKVPSPEWEKEFLKVVILMAISFTRLKCFQSLGGLFAWCKENFGMKLYWLKNLMELVKDKSESGTEALKDTLAKLLTSETSSYDNSCLSLIHRELSLGFAATCDFDTYNEWMQQYRHRLDDLMESEDNDSTTFLRALSEFSEGVTPSLPPPPSQSTPDPFTSTSLLTACHLKLLQAASCFHQTRQTWSDPGKIMDSLDSANVSLTLLMRDHRLAGNGEGEQQAHILSMVHRELHALVNDKGGRLDLLLTYKKSSHRSKPLLWIKKWGDYFVKYQKENDPQLFMHLNALNLEISKTARKEENLNLSYDYLYKALIGGYHSAGTARHQIGGYVQSLDFSSLILTADRAACIRQYAKLSYLSGEKENAVRAMCGIVNSVGALLFTSDSSAANAATAELFEVSSRAVHNLTSWFRADTGLIDSVYPDTKPGNTSSGGVSLTQVLQLEKNLVGHLEFLPVVEQATDNDMVVGRLLRHAVNQAPMMAKLWHSLATWALDLGEKVLESCQKEGISLTEDERQSVLQSLPPGATKSQMEPVFQLLQQHRLISQLGEKKMIEISRHEYMRNELAATAGIDDAQLIDKIHAVWMQLQRRTYFYHETAVNAYFEYIALNSGGNGDQLITATLRLLQLTVKYALELQESLQAGLEATPSAKWRPIIPQLFSRLNHPVRSVRNRISELICRIAQDFPHLIIFPAVVGSASSVTTEADKIYKHLTSVVDEDEGVIDEDSSDEVGPNPEMRGAYAQIVDAMVKQCGGAVEQVQRFVNELQRISLLWDELWLGTLQQYTHDIAKRIKKMEEEVHRLSRNDTLSLEEKKHLALDKYHIIFKPLLFVFEKVFSITDKQAETPHEAYFHRNYREIINKTMEKIRNPSDPCHPKESWGTFGQLQSTLSSKLLTKTSLKLSDISPTLLAMKGTQIPMPGLTDNREVDISSLENGLHILLTKTKPKKVAFQGNDGRKYTYLFKGLEDLHLDERIMQFLTIANVMMKKTGREYRARHYSVVPLGPRSGLIQWVGGPIPLYSIFKKCQVRQQMTTGDRKTGGGGSKSGTNIQKPSEAFYNKLYPLLRDKGIAIENRRSWPLSVMRQVMQELISETPDNLLAQELWYGSVDSQHWFELQQNMTRSLAVMSVIGYIIGLGDRHLDNLLMDLKHGEIIHIDHNICFEKGKHLRIPERVPCRLSQNIVRLFGLTGVEGLFRSACEHTLQTLRAGKDTLMCLLEAFIYDPLVDWTPGVFELGIAGAYHGGMQQGDIGGGGDRVVQDKRDMQSEITFSMYAVRVAEMKGPWMDNRTELLELLSGMEDRLVAYAEQKIVIGGIIKQLSKMHHSMAILKEAEANPSHRLYSLHDRFVEHNMIENAVKAAKEKVASFVEENEKWGNLHQRALITVSPVHLSKWTADLAAVNTNPNASGSLIKGFLENAGQGSLLEQFQNVEGSFCIGVENLKHTLLSCLQLLGHYGNISGLYPQSSKALHRTAQYVSLATRMTEDFTVATSQDVIADFTRRFIDTDFTAAAEDNGRRRLRQHHLLNLNYQMEAWGTEMNMRLRNIFQRMINEGIENSGAVMLELTGAKMELLQHLNGNDKGRVRMFGDIVVIRLATIASRLAELETVASKSEDGIVDVVPPGHENEWSLLDEIRMQLGVASNLLDTMDLVGAMPADSEAAAMAAEAFQQQQKVSKQIAQFSSNFYVIIMQEGLKSFQKEDQSG
jgi:PI-3-kinase-related kinase SMG-1